MAYLQNSILEGFSTIKPLFFNGTNFNYWKNRMDCYFKSIDYDIWYIVMHGDIIPRKKVDDRFVDKVHEVLDEKDKMLRPKIS